MALLFPSVGPIYYDAQLFDAISPHAPIAHTIQKELYKSYVDVMLSKTDGRGVSIYSGIAAMPSLHVAVVALYCLFFYGRSRLLFYLSGIYLAFIQIGAVLLGWHYAIDGYVGIILAFYVFIFSQRWINWLDKRGHTPFSQAGN